jgi:fibro-slime domain-containing protein
MRVLPRARVMAAVISLTIAAACGCVGTIGLGDDAGAGPGGRDAALSGDDAGTNGNDAMRGDDATRGDDAMPGDDGALRSGSDAGTTSCAVIEATLRDFHSTHPDFNAFSGTTATKGLVGSLLGADGKPVYTGICEEDDEIGPCPNDAQTTSREHFDQWYRDVVGVNQTFKIQLPLTQTAPNQYVFDSAAFFPLDGQGFGNEGDPHNYSFTTEIHTKFTYRGGEVFTFRGDDDVWVFVNGRLALDIGGLHHATEDTLSFDAQAAALGIVVGNDYTLDVFHAERARTQSNFRIQTSIECFVPID